MLKPDAGQRGFGVRVVENKDRAIEYFEQADGMIVAQRYDPGPCEFGLLWARDMDSATDAPMDDRPGFIFSITRKEFPVVEGDGESTLEQLSWKHRRYRMQGRVFQKRHEANRDLGMMGAYRPGTDKTLDEAIALHPRMVAFLSQGTRDQVTLADAADQMQELMARAA